jgi:hypothetical protein
MAPTEKHEVEAMLEHENVDCLQDYLRRGRSLQHLDGNAVADRWASLMHLWADGSSDFSHQARDDCQSEMIIRGIELPFERIAEAWERIRARSQTQTDALLKDPRRLAAKEAELEENLQAFRDLTKSKSKH